MPETRLPARQGRLAFVMLAAERARSLSREELADEIWSGDPPPAWDAALRAIMSKLRGVLSEADLDGSEALASAFGCYQLKLPVDAWVDVEAAADAIHRAETAFRAGNPAEANGWTLVAGSVSGRPFLIGEDGPWVTRRRAVLRDIRVRSLECRCEILLSMGDHTLAVRDATEVLDLEPFRETGYQLLMRAQAGARNPAEALRTYERCRALLKDELGASPSPPTEALHLEILRSS